MKINIKSKNILAPTTLKEELNILICLDVSGLKKFNVLQPACQENKVENILLKKILL